MTVLWQRGGVDALADAHSFLLIVMLSALDR